MDVDVKGFGRVVGLSGERLRYYKRIMAFFNKYATFHFEAYNSTDDVTNPQTNVIYLVGPKGNLDDKYEEYIYDNTKQDPWIKIGDTSIDLSQYATVAELIEELSKYTTTEDLSELLDKKQNTEEGKGLSTNDFTDNLKGKLDGIQSGAQKNVNADWNSESGDSQILNKPDLSEFITKTVNDLTNYYLKSEVYTKDQVAAIIATINQFHYEVHPTLNEIVSPQNNVLYLIGPTGTGSDKYEEYIYPSVETGWTKIGDTSIDLRNYVTIDTLNTALATKQDVISDLINIRAGAAAGATALQTIDETLTDQEFVYRVCPSTINPKSIILNKIKGKTLVWNQLVANGNFADGATNWYVQGNHSLNVVNNVAICTANGTIPSGSMNLFNTAPSSIVGHKYYFSCELFLPSSNAGVTSLSVGLRGALHNSFVTTDVWTRISDFTVISATENIFIVSNNISAQAGDVYKVRNIKVIDLTLMFGAGNEPATVEEFESLFPGYHDYNAGKLISNDTKEIETVGFNQWDEEWENGALNAETGGRTTSSTQIRSKNYIPVLPNTVYCASHPYTDAGAGHLNRLAFYDANKNYLGSSGWNSFESGDTATSPASAAYALFCINCASYAHNICFNISDPAKNGTYEPYKKSKINLNLNSFKVKDSQGNIITISGGLKSAGNVHDEIIGDKYIKRVGEVDLGTVVEGDWRKQSTGNFITSKFTSVMKGASVNTEKGNLLSNKLVNSVWNTAGTNSEMAVSAVSTFFVGVSGIDSIPELVNFLQGVLLYYELTTPIEYELIEPIVPIAKAGITEARISPNTDGLSAPFCGDITYTLTDIYVPELKSINYVTEITWSELKTLRDNNQLSPGMQYRITDYQCITTQAYTQSAGHQFDIIVLATDINKLSEDAKAIMHDNTYDVTFNGGEIRRCYFYPVNGNMGSINIVDCHTLLGISEVVEGECEIDDINKTIMLNYDSSSLEEPDLEYNHFKDCNLGAWKLKYCLDNDTNRFAWANSTNGKGIIYWMKDEWDNECPYDFKNIQFKRWAITNIINSNMESVALNSLKSKLLYASGYEHCFSFKSSNITINGATVVVNSNNYKWYYTFGETDGSLVNAVRDNKISYFSDTSSVKSLPNIVFINTSANVANCYKNILYNCSNSTFDYGFVNNIINYSNNNIISYNYTSNKMYNSNNNIINRDCDNNILDTINNNFISDTFQNNIVKNFRLNNIGYSFQFNICENNFYSNNIENTCNSNIFKTGFSNSTIKSSCNYNVFGISCSYINLKSYCQYNIFENGCSNINLESNCKYSIFENHCRYIYIEKSYIEHIIVESGNMNITITSTQTTSSANTLRNFKIVQGVNMSGVTKTISHDTVNDTFQTIYKPVNSVEIEV